MEKYKKLRFSAVILTKNEADKIARCLESVKWADEIVIVDDESCDDTVEICRKYTDNIIIHKLDGDFANQRNIGTESSHGDWILQLDADEVVTEDMRRAIEKILSGDEEYSAYKFRRQNFFLGKAMKYGGWYYYCTHLFRKERAIYKGSVHETLVVDGPIGILEEKVKHYPFNSISEFVERQNRYTDLQSQKMLTEMGLKDEVFIRKSLLRRIRKIFWKTYIKKKGFLDGAHGFIFSVLYAWIEFAKWAKYWELCKKTRQK